MSQVRSQSFLKVERSNNQNLEGRVNTTVSAVGCESPYFVWAWLRDKKLIFMIEIEKQIIFPNAESAIAAVKAVSVELINKYEKRSKTTIKTNKNVVLLKVVAQDDSALKASLNTYERLLGLCKEISKI